MGQSVRLLSSTIEALVREAEQQSTDGAS